MVSKKTGLLLAGTLAATTFVGVGANNAQASSHREAPAISLDPTADNTDVYAFRDTTNPAMLNIVANYIGLEDPNGGPIFGRFGEDVQYSIHVDNNGDVADDIVYSFRFRTKISNPNTFLYNTGQLTSPTDPDLSLRQTYSVVKVTPNSKEVLADNAIVPPVNVGIRSVPFGTYEDNIAQPTVTPLGGGGKVFAGSRKDPFFADTGSIFDLGALRPINGAHLIPNPAGNGSGNVGVDILNDKNVHTIALQVPIASVADGGVAPTVVDAKKSVIGVHATAQRRRFTTLANNGRPSTSSGGWIQVSRLGIPLVNEVLIPLGSKDRFNGTEPKDDGDRGFFDFILDPELTRLLPVLYPTVFSANNIPAGGAANRPDLVRLVTGQLAGLSPGNALPPADLLRINLASPVGAKFPNGRQLADDVVDIEIQVLAGALLDADGFINNTSGAGSSGIPFSALRDGVDASTGPLLNKFPYVGTPFDGYNAYNCDLIKSCPADAPRPSPSSPPAP